MEKGKAIYISTNQFPNGDAGGVRVEALSQLLVECGYHVDVASYGASTGFKILRYTEGISYFSFRSTHKNLLSRILSRLFMAFRLRKSFNFAEYNLIVIDSVPYSVIKLVSSKSKRYSIPVIHDSVEWYSKSEYKFGGLSFRYIEKNFLNRRWIKKRFGVIAISSYLKKHFDSRGNQTIRIPFVLDTTNCKPITIRNTNKIIFQYAGLMGNKDFLGKFFEALVQLDCLDEVEVRIYGADESYLLKTNNITPNELDILRPVLKIYGRVPREEVLESLKDADFTVLFRDSRERYAQAGFPTKVVESMSQGVPVLCNDSSDLSMYLKNGFNSYIVTDYTTDAILSALRVITKLSKDQLILLKENAWNTASEYFDYRKYRDEFQQFVNNLI